MFYLRFGRADKKDIFKSFRMDLNSCATSRREACMESMQSIVWNPLQDGMESSRRKCTFGDSIRLRRYHTRWRVITYQACGLNKKSTSRNLSIFLVGEAGFGPAKSVTTDLQSAPFGRSGIPPGAGERSRTINLLITNQLLCHWATPAYSEHWYYNRKRRICQVLFEKILFGMKNIKGAGEFLLRGRIKSLILLSFRGVREWCAKERRKKRRRRVITLYPFSFYNQLENLPAF